MPIAKPYHRIYRELIKANNSGYSSWAFIVDNEYAKTPHQFTKGFLILQEDIKSLFEYVEPSDINLKTYSYRIHELLMRTCIEVESNFKAILRENIYTPTFRNGANAGQLRTEGFWNINDYLKTNKSHHLDNYFVGFPFWRGAKNRYQPFYDWQLGSSLSWYQAYNEAKHDKNDKFELANFENLLTAFAGLFALLSSQFNCESFQPGHTLLTVGNNSFFDGEFGLGGYLKIEFPQNWTNEEKYDFDWSVLKEETLRFQKFDYNNI
jgi:hypothetical protein